MNIISRIRKSYITKGLAVCLAFNMLAEFMYPTAAMALTSGPSQPEVQSFEPIETTDMVNLFTGDFTYNIPLMHVPGPNGGYPINLAYHAGISMDQEASWVGLGWNINAGAINRGVKGVPDDFYQDTVKVKKDMKDNWTLGLGVGGSIEFVGGDANEGTPIAPSLGLNFYFNNYKGFGYSLDAGVGFGGEPSVNVGLSLDSEDGVGANASISFQNKFGEDLVRHNSIGLGFNSRRGLSMNTSTSVSKLKYTTQKIANGRLFDKKSDHNHESFESTVSKWGALNVWDVDQEQNNIAQSSSLSFADNSYSPGRNLPMNNYRLGISIANGWSEYCVNPKLHFSGFFDTQTLQNKGEFVDQETYGYENFHEGEDFGDFSRTFDGNVSKTASNLHMPQLTHDFYNIQGQGVGGSFRPYRNETGRIYDPYSESINMGGFFNLDLGGNKAGWGGGANTGYSVQRAWDNGNSASDIDFSDTRDLWELQNDDNRVKEMVFYRSRGDKASLSTDEMDHIEGEGPVRPLISGNGFTGNYQADLPVAILAERDVTERVGRNNLIHKVKNVEIDNFHINDNDLGTGYATGTDDFLHEYEIFYYDWSDMDQTEDPDNYLNRKVRTPSGSDPREIKHHNAGFKVLDESGSYYVYGLPAYNNKKVESLFSINAAVDSDPDNPNDAIFEAKESVVQLPLDQGDLDYEQTNTQKFLSSTETPPFAYSYLLTSIVGSDYVDVGNDGLTEDDKGYWVKFDYVKYADDYQWRAPYSGCMYSPGNPATLEDDKGSYSYGEKEIWYLSRIQTSTHIVIFDLSERLDNIEVDEELNQEESNKANERGTLSGLKIDKISLYEKSAYQSNPTTAVPIQEVHFQYDYNLCQGIPNNNGQAWDGDGDGQTDDNQGGKLTLKKVWFTYEGNSRGALNPYEFDYGNGTNNPSYSTENYDRWGNYKPNVSGVAADDMRDYNQSLTYVHQYNQGHVSSSTLENETNKSTFKSNQDQNVSAWSLEKISLPSGGEIDIDYESDDYAFVQDARATQMTYITSVNDNTTASDALYNADATTTVVNDFESPDERRIYFKLEEPLPVIASPNATYSQTVYDDYVNDIISDENGDKNLYFRAFCKLKGVAEDYVAGYLPLETELSSVFESTTYYHYGVDPGTTASIDGVSSYTHGFVTIQPTYKKDGTTVFNYHPIALLAWQHIRTNAPEILSDMGSFTESEIANLDTDKAKAKKVKNLFGWIPEIAQTFSGYRLYSYNQGLARTIDLDKSMIRLTSPDQVKYGGGLRVKQISMSDNWKDFESTEDDESYGLVYDYKTIDQSDPNLPEISSGVAQYEPLIGGDEIALRYPRHYPGHVPFKSNNNLFFEYPINEAYMPAPVVGYSKVTVTSLNTDQQITKALDTNDDPEPGRGVSGVTEYEFYTAKDFPVLTEETTIAKKNTNVPILIPFIATYKRNKMAASQGYKIELNDMHGKLKSTATFGLNENYEIEPDPISKTTYLYHSQSAIRNGHVYYKLKNDVPVLTVDQTDHSYDDTEERLVGVEYEFFTDQRHNKSANLTIGFNYNLDGVVFGGAYIPIPSFWGTVNSTKNDLRTFVTNKIIHKSGILEKVEVQNEHYVSTVENMLYDKESGRPLVTRVYNEFSDPIYDLKHPAHFEYEGMGHAYKNINLEFEATLSEVSTSEKLYSGTIPTEVIDELVPGDELIVHAEEGASYRNYKATFITKDYGNAGKGVFHLANYPTGENDITGYFKVYRSGRRNHYMADAGNIQMKGDPITNQTVVNDDFAAESGTVSAYDYVEFDNVLNATAVTFRDNWETESGDNENPYATGEMGIWRAYKSLVYTGDRTQTTTGVDISEDGVMNDVPQFVWQVIDFEKYYPLWQWGSEVTRYNEFGYEIENVDRLGIFSAALYGYDKAFAIGVGGNAEYEELGAEDFERFTLSELTGYDADDNPGEMDLEGNLNFYESASGAINIDIHDQFNILGGLSQTGNTSYVILDLPYDGTYWNNIDKIDLSLIANFNGLSHDLRLIRPVLYSHASHGGGSKTKLNFAIKPESVSAGVMYLPSDVKLQGKVTTIKSKSVLQPANTDKTTFVEDFAHTGKQCMKLASSSAVEFNHGRLQLKANKEYTLSFWMRRDDASVPFYDITNIIEVEDVESSQVDLVDEIRTGRIVEGWQKVEVDFTPDTDGNLIRTTFNTGSTVLYIDDIRLAPKTGGIITYVYNPNNFRLVATLNANNYATFYFYDEQGNLYLTKLETEEGIFTISENHGYRKATASN